MNATEYKAYTETVAEFLRVCDVKPGCYSPTGSRFFSWRPCECCERDMGGDRETYTFAQSTGLQFPADICTNCVYFLTYGQLDDMAMEEIEA